MKRALIVLTVIAVLTTGIFAEGSSEGAADSYTLRLSHVLPTDHQNHKTAVKFAELVKEKTGGKVNIEIFPAAQLGNEKEITDSVAMGTLDFALCGFGEVTKRFPVSGIFDGPFVFRDREHLAQVYTSDIFWDIMADMEEVGIQMVSPRILRNPSRDNHRYAGQNTRRPERSQAPLSRPAHVRGDHESYGCHPRLPWPFPRSTLPFSRASQTVRRTRRQPLPP